MIVHPIGMMRANAAATGLNFVDDFTSYTLGDRITAYNPPYQNVGGFGDGVIVADSGGVRVARLLQNQEVVKFTGGAFAANREVALTIKTIGSGGPIIAYINYVDTDNFTMTRVWQNGDIGLQHKVAGAFGVNTSYPAAFVAGNILSLSKVGTTLTLKNGGTTLATATITAISEGEVRFHFSDNASPSSFWEVSRLQVKDI